jgi:hypothetical protein
LEFGVKFSRPLKWFVALLLPLTFFWKLTLQSDNSALLKDTLTNFLFSQKFTVTDTEQQLNEMPVIVATKKECRMYIMRASPDGWNRDIVKNYASVADQIFVIFRGKIFNEQVSWRILIGYLQSEIFHRLGLVPHESSLIAVVANPACAAERLPWHALRDL